RVATHLHWPDTGFNKAPQPASRTFEIALQHYRQRLASRDVKKPLWGLHPGHTRIAEIPQGMLQNGRKRARIGIADDNKIAVGLLHSVAQIPGLKADVAGAGDVLDSFLVGYLLHGSPFAIVEHVDLQINRVRIGDLLGVSDTQADQL